MISKLIRSPVEDVKVGMRVSVAFEQQLHELWLPQFKPAG
jgi:hypothetical protein